ncbi:MAG: hypothetical protein WCO44_01810 [Bacteroidota bacterium]
MKSTKLALRFSGTIFGFVALLHLARLITGVPILIAGFSLPVWMNIVGFLATCILSIWLWSLTVTTSSINET